MAEMHIRQELFPGGTRVMEHLCVSPADASEFSISAARSGGSLEGTQSVHSVLLMMRMPIIRTILQDTTGNLCHPDSVIITESDWKDVVNVKSLLYYNRCENCKKIQFELCLKTQKLNSNYEKTQNTKCDNS